MRFITGVRGAGLGLMALVLAGCVSTSSVPDQGAAANSTSTTQAAASSGVFEARLAAFRAQNGRKSLTRHPQMDAAALAHAQDMVEKGYFSHRDPKGRIMSDRIRKQGYRPCSSVENIAADYASEAAVFEAWINSPGHRRGLLNPKVNHWGLAKAGDKWVYVAARKC